jgi:LuxR family transcriptional regulator
VEAYVDGGMFRDGVMLKWAIQEHRRGELGRGVYRAICCGAAHQGRAGDAGAQRASRHRRRLHDQLSHGLKNANAGIGLAARRGLTQDDADAIWAEHGEIIQIINHVAHLCILQLPATGQRRLLTPRQAEVLELVADGKTMQDIALILDRNVATVEKHLRGARDALGVETTAQAVRKASILNQIFRLDRTRSAEARRPHLAGAVSDNR